MATNKGAELLESLKTQGLSQQEMLNRLDAIIDAESARRAGINRDHRFVFGNFDLQIIVSDVIVVFAAGFNRNFAGPDVQRQVPVPFFLVFLGKFIAFAF